jgi:hypothetical protein
MPPRRAPRPQLLLLVGASDHPQGPPHLWDAQPQAMPFMACPQRWEMGRQSADPPSLRPRTPVRYRRPMTPEERNRITANLIQARCRGRPTAAAWSRSAAT